MTTLNIDKSLQVRHNYSGHLWCGIGSLSAALKIQTSKARELIRSVSLRKYIKAVSYIEMRDALIAGGAKTSCLAYPRNWRECPTLGSFYEETIPENSPHTWVICITGHWVVIRKGRWVCSMNQYGRLMSDCPYLQSRVRHAIRIN